MTIIILSIACTAFVAGFCLGLMGIALFASLRTESSDHDAGAAEGDQFHFNRQNSAARIVPTQRVG